MKNLIINIIIGLTLFTAPLLQAQNKPKGEIEDETEVLNLGIDRVKLIMEIRDNDTDSLVFYGEVQATNSLDSSFVSLFDKGYVQLNLPINDVYQIGVISQRYKDTSFVFDLMEVEEYEVNKIIRLIPTKEEIIITIEDIDVGDDVIPIDIILTNTNRNEKIRVNGNSGVGEYIVDIRDTDLYRLEITDTGDYIFYSGTVKSDTKDATENAIKLEVDFNKLEVGKKILLQDISFAPYSSELNEHVKKELDRIQSVLIAHPEYVIEIGGHTDNHDPESDNIWLAKERAEAAFAYLVLELKLPSKQFVIKGYQDSKPVASNITAKGRAMNRRFELKVIDKIDTSQANLVEFPQD